MQFKLTQLVVTFGLILFSQVIFAENVNKKVNSSSNSNVMELLQTVKDNPSNSQAWYNLGVIYEQGIESNADLTKAKRYYLKSISLGNAAAMFNMGSISAKEKDYQLAMSWWKKAAAKNLPQAHFNIGMLHEKGLGVEKDLDEAIKWYRKAANLSFVPENDSQSNENKLANKTNIPSKDKPAISVKQNKAKPQRKAQASTKSNKPIIIVKKLPNKNKDVKQKLVKMPKNNSRPSISDQLPKVSKNTWAWLLSQPKNNYTIQLAAFKKPTDAESFVKEHAILNEAKILRSIVKKTQYHKIVYGRFDSWNDAANQISQLSPNLRKLRPWIRRFSILANELPENEKIDKQLVIDFQQSDNVKNTQSTFQNKFDFEDVIKPVNNPLLQTKQNQEKNIGSTQVKSETTEELPAISSIVITDQTAVTDIVDKSINRPMKTKNVFTNNEIKQISYSKSLPDENKIEDKSLSTLSLALNSIKVKEYSQAFRLLKPLVVKGDIEAHYQTALLYYQGKGVEHDPTLAFKSMMFAAERGHSNAQKDLATFYSKGVGVPVSSRLSEYWKQTYKDNLKFSKN